MSVGSSSEDGVVWWLLWSKIKAVYSEIDRWYSLGMTKITTSTALMVRLFVEREGLGNMMASVPRGMVELAHRISADAAYGDKLGLTKDGRVSFVMEPELWPFVDDVRNIPKEALQKDRRGLHEMMSRVAVSGFETRPLLREEFDYLEYCLGEGAWQRGITYVA